MSKRQRDTAFERASRIYALLLWLYPRAHRQAFGEQMRQAFADHYRDTVETGGESEAQYWTGVIADEGKSLLREHVSALSVRISTMKKLSPAIWAPVLIVAVGALLSALLNFFSPNGFTPRTALPLWVALVVALLFLVARLTQSVQPPAEHVSWLPLGLLLGGVTGLYMVALNLFNALAPIPSGQSYGDNVGTVWLATIPLLAGVVGVVGGYASGRARTGAAAGLLAGGVMLFLQLATAAFLVVVLWNALQANALHSQLQVGAQGWIQQRWNRLHPGQPPDLWTYLTNWNDDDSFAFGMVFQAFFTLIVWPIAVIVGSMIGARAARRAGVTQGSVRAVSASSSSIRLAALLVTLGVLIWSAFTVIAGMLTDGSPLAPINFLGASFVTPAFAAWLLAFLVIVAASALTARPTRATPVVRVDAI